MIEPISPGLNPATLQSIAAVRDKGAVGQANQEFMAIFYKELLKQVFKAPNLSPAIEDEQSPFSNPVSAMNSDLMIDHLAAEMARRQSLNLPAWALTGQGNK